jgi:signal transduction histidine kinase/CheY-like chemotaxis protein
MWRTRYLHALLLAGITVTVLALGWIVGRDLRQAPEAASQLYTQLARGLDLVDELEFTTQEVRRILLYALHTSDANLQLEYAEQSRTTAQRIEQLLAASAAARPTVSGSAELDRVGQAWREYVTVRDEVIGLILEGSLREGVMLDQAEGTARFNDVRASVAALKSRFESDAAIQVAEARAHAERATRRLLVLVVSALLAAAGGIFLVNRRAALEAVEAELRRARDAAEAATAAKSDFLATMSHELRTPLNGVIGLADLLRAEELSPEQRDLLRMLRTSAAALLGLVSDILDYSRIEAGLLDVKPSTWALADCIEDAFDPVTEAAARKGLDIGYVIDADVPAVVTADRDRVAQVLLNLLSNAVKFTDSGEVSVHVSATPFDEARVEIRIRVRDTGPGIPGHLHEQLFKRFTQLDAGAARRHGGAGLGLAIAQRLSRLLGGTLRLDSAVGQGAAFVFSFTATASPEAAAARPASPFGAKSVLLRTGPGIVGEHLRSLLSQWGVRVYVAAAHGDILAEHYDAVVIDADVVREDQCRSGPGIPIVGVSRARALASAGSGSGVHAIGKPVRARALAEALGCALGAAPPRAAPTPLPDRPFAGHPIPVLLVEDNAANRRVMQMMLEELGLEDVDGAVDGAEAVARARARDYDVILMDVQMPGVDGLEATRRIRAEPRRQRPTIIALTANVMQGEERRCREAGMDGYLAKPLRLETLAAALSAVLRQGLSP